MHICWFFLTSSTALQPEPTWFGMPQPDYLPITRGDQPVAVFLQPQVRFLYFLKLFGPVMFVKTSFHFFLQRIIDNFLMIPCLVYYNSSESLSFTILHLVVHGLIGHRHPHPPYILNLYKIFINTLKFQKTLLRIPYHVASPP